MKSHCSTYLSSNFYVPNLCRMLVDSILHRLGTFKSHCSNYLCCNFYVPNLCRMLVVSILHRLGTGDNFKKCQNHFQSKIYPICVESLHIPICKHSTQIGYIKFFGIFEDVPNLCRMLAHRYMQAFYTDWVHKIWHSTQIGYIFLHF